MISNDAVCCAQRQVTCALRCEPPGSRSLLPFDPSDGPDLRTWLEEKIATDKKSRYYGSSAHKARALIWDALDEARKARRKVPHVGGVVVPVAGVEALESVIDKPPNEDWAAAVVSVAKAVAAAARQLVSSSTVTHRKAKAVLSCVARTVRQVKAEFGPEIAEDYVRNLLQTEDFRWLPLSQGDRAQFEELLRRLEPTRNVRNDIANAGLSWAGTKQWQEFKCALAPKTKSHGEAIVT